MNITGKAIASDKIELTFSVDNPEEIKGVFIETFAPTSPVGELPTSPLNSDYYYRIKTYEPEPEKPEMFWSFEPINKDKNE